jgi:hypothetical protein
MDTSRYYIGKISKVEDRVFYKIRVSVDGIVDDAMAFPMKGEVDEPLVGDKVLLYNIDPTFGSVYLYSRIKEDNFIGFRSYGKIITLISPYETEDGQKGEDDKIVIGIYDVNEEDGNEDEVGEYITSITINRKDDDKKGSVDLVIGNDKYNGGPKANLNIKVKGNVEANIEGGEGSAINISNNSTIKIGGNANIEVQGNTDLKSQGKCTVNSPSGINIESSATVTITGGGTLKTSGTCGASPNGGFCGIPFCPFSGNPQTFTTITGI